MSLYEEVLYAGLKSDEAFQKALRKILKEFHVDIGKLSGLSGVSESSLYKILSGKRVNPRLSTFRSIINALRSLETPEGEPFIAIIAARPTLDAIGITYVEGNGCRIRLKEYAATSMEDVIIASLRAQKEGAKAIVCAPIVSTTVEKITRIPVSACPVTLCKEPLLKAAEIAALKILSE